MNTTGVLMSNKCTGEVLHVDVLQQNGMLHRILYHKGYPTHSVLIIQRANGTTVTTNMFSNTG